VVRSLRSLLAVVCVAAAGLVVTAGPANATPTVQPPQLTKTFTPSTIQLNGVSQLGIVISNPNTSALTGVTITDALPAGLVFTTPETTSFCGGTVVVTTTTFTFTGGTIGAGALCGFLEIVQGVTAGNKVNTANATTTQTGPAGLPAMATLTVLPPVPPTLTKAFSPSTVTVGATTTLTFTLTNPNLVGLSRITFADPFPGGLGVAANPAVFNSCGGVPSVGPFALAVAYANASLRPGGSCTFSVNVTATSAGVKNNTTTIVSSSAGIGSPASGTLTVTP
jgi:uncharacterized repeat protein (TIGR01451 family)